MTDNVRKIFEILGVEPNEEFEVMLKDNSKFSYKFKLDENLQGYCFRDKWRLDDALLRILLSGAYKIIKLPKELINKKKLRDLTMEEYKKWVRKNCSNLSCEDCVFLKAKCNTNSIGCWINHKDAYSDKFLDQEIEVEE